MIAQACGKVGGSLDCAYLRKGWGTLSGSIHDLEGGGYPRWYLGDLEGGGYPRWQIDGCAGIHDVEIWVSGWGELEGGKVTRSQPPRGLSRMGQTDCGHPRFVMVCRYSKTARNAATCALGIATSEPMNPAPSCGFEHRNP